LSDIGAKKHQQGQEEATMRLRVATGALLCAATMIAVSALAQNQDKDKGGVNVTVKTKDTDAGLVIKSQATAKEVGLPLYPGSRPHKDSNDDSSGANLGLWGNTFGFKVVALKMESDDSPDKIAAFYQKALGKYGKVLDCANNSATTSEKDKDSDTLTCENDKPDAGGRLFKAGTKHKQHIVGIKPAGHGFEYDLVYLEVRGDTDKSPL
jgi:hypothetical protein